MKEKEISIDLSKDLQKMLWRNRFLMWRLSIERDFTFKEKVKIFFTGKI